MLLSVIIPVYNSDKSIKKTIDSILNQSFSDFELIIVDDGSTDSSYDICKRIARNKKNITVIKQQNSGPSSARNQGINISKGNYITFVDADDTVELNYFFTISEAIKDHSPSLILFEYRIIQNNKKISNVGKLNEQFLQGNKNVISSVPKLIEKGLFNSPCNKVYASEIIKDNDLQFDDKYNLGEDFLFNLEYIEHIENLYQSNSILYNYFLNENSLTHSYQKDKFEKIKKITKKFKNFVLKHSLSINHYYKKMLKNGFSSILDLNNPSCNLSRREKVQMIDLIISDNEIMQMLENYRPKKIPLYLLSVVLRTRNSLIIFYISNIIYIFKIKFKPYLETIKNFFFILKKSRLCSERIR